VISNDTNDVFEVGEEVFLNLNEKDIRVLND
jgi:iron(III) transport system ATP-binding protein